MIYDILIYTVTYVVEVALVITGEVSWKIQLKYFIRHFLWPIIEFNNVEQATTFYVFCLSMLKGLRVNIAYKTSQHIVLYLKLGTWLCELVCEYGLTTQGCNILLMLRNIRKVLIRWLKLWNFSTDFIMNTYQRDLIR